MSTCNFSLPNTDKHYTIGVDRDLEDFEYDDIFENIQSELIAIGGFAYDKDEWLHNNVRVVAEFDIPWYDREYRQWENLKLIVTAESGYYQGAMFDIDNSEFDGITLNKTTQAKYDRLWRKIELILARNTFALVRVATFSNGEAIYEPASNKRSLLKSVANGYMKE